MSNFTDFFPAPGGGGGGGGIPKYQEFIISGTFTPSQALIDAGGRLAVFVVAGGGGGPTTTGQSTGGVGGEVLMQYVTLTNTNAVTVTIGGGGGQLGIGGNTTFAASSAGGIDIVALGGPAGENVYYAKPYDILTAGFGGAHGQTDGSGGAGSGVLGYGVGGSSYKTPGIGRPKANSGDGAGYNQLGGSGFVRVTWFE